MTGATAADVLANRARWGCERADTLTWLRALPADSVHCVVTSPPYYGLRAYLPAGHPDKALEIGLEDTPAAYVARLVEVFAEVKRVLHPSGTVWLNIGDSYANDAKGPNAPAGNLLGTPNQPAVQKPWRNADGVKKKDRLMIPARVALALQESGWWLRDEIVWAKKSPMPSSVRDRTCAAHEMVYLLAKRPRYFFDQQAIQEPAVYAGSTGCFSGSKTTARASARGQLPSGNEKPGAGRVTVGDTRIKRSVWRVSASPVKAAHFATMPVRLVAPCILAGTSAHGVCPACGEPWVRVTAKKRVPTRPGADSKTTGDRLTDGNRDPLRHVTRTETTGWAAGCKCDRPDVVPAVVLDPFAGAGTTLMVAHLLGRRAIGCDLNADYLGIITDRMAGVRFGGGLPAKKPKPVRRERPVPTLFAEG